MSGLRIMVNGYTKESLMDIIDILQDVIDEVGEDSMTCIIYADDIIAGLEAAGFMIVPIEDPTNLFGVMEDSV
jgi:hypothetical protein